MKRITRWNEIDAEIRAGRERRQTWRQIGNSLGISASAAKERGVSHLGLPGVLPDPTPPMSIREESAALGSYAVALSLGRPDTQASLPPGTPHAWEILTAGTCLEGIAFDRS